MTDIFGAKWHCKTLWKAADNDEGIVIVIAVVIAVVLAVVLVVVLVVVFAVVFAVIITIVLAIILAVIIAVIIVCDIVISITVICMCDVAKRQHEREKCEARHDVRCCCVKFKRS
jgi:hypothetical protein